MLTHGSLFSGIGGFEKGAEFAGIKTIYNCEIEKYPRNILKKHFPETKQYTNILTDDINEYVDIISGGFPCQDISNAGRMEGITGARSGLWSEMFKIIRRNRPKYVIIENSPALLIRGFEKVLGQISEIGYNAEWQVISNIAFGYPHRRERLYVIAYTHEIGLQQNLCKQGNFRSIFKQWTSNSNIGYSLSKRILEIGESSDIRNGNGFRHWTHRVASIGNSVNPTLAYYLFDCIKSHYKHLNNENFRTNEQKRKYSLEY